MISDTLQEVFWDKKFRRQINHIAHEIGPFRLFSDLDTDQSQLKASFHLKRGIAQRLPRGLLHGIRNSGSKLGRSYSLLRLDLGLVRLSDGALHRPRQRSGKSTTRQSVESTATESRLGTRVMHDRPISFS